MRLFTSARRNVFYRAHLPSPPLLRLVPASHARPPSIHVPAILFVVCPEFAEQSGLFIKDNKQMYGEGDRSTPARCGPKCNPTLRSSAATRLTRHSVYKQQEAETEGGEQT
jgi:hypothetical protein